jgi:hypothetical protein
VRGINDAQRIRDRAIQRAGELLSEIKAQRSGDRRSAKSKVPRGTIDRKQAAADAGLTPKQAKTAIEVARVEKKLADERVAGLDQHRRDRGRASYAQGCCDLYRQFCPRR